MSTFSIQARLFEGPLARPIRDEVRLADTDNWDTALLIAHELIRAGFTVWIYSRNGAGADLRLVKMLRPQFSPRAKPCRAPPTSPPRRLRPKDP